VFMALLVLIISIGPPPRISPACPPGGMIVSGSNVLDADCGLRSWENGSPGYVLSISIR